VPVAYPQFVQKVILLDDDTLLVQVLSGVSHVSPNTGEISYLYCEDATIALWDQESLVVSIDRYELPSLFFLWYFRRGGGDEKSKTTNPVEGRQARLMETLQLGYNGEEKYLAVGIDREVRLLRVPSFEVVHILREPSVGSVYWILPLLDSNAFMCGYSNWSSESQLVRWSTTDDNNNKAISGPFKHQLFEGIEGPLTDLLQMRHDPRKLIVCHQVDDMNSKRSCSVWDIETATVLYVLSDLTVWCRQCLFELGDSGLFASVFINEPGLKIWDLRGEEDILLLESNHKAELGIQLNNGNIMLLHHDADIIYIEEYQVTR